MKGFGGSIYRNGLNFLRDGIEISLEGFCEWVCFGFPGLGMVGNSLFLR